MDFKDETRKPQEPGRLLLEVRDITTARLEYLVGCWIEHGGYWAAQTLIETSDSGIRFGHRRMPRDLAVLRWARIED